MKINLTKKEVSILIASLDGSISAEDIEDLVKIDLEDLKALRMFLIYCHQIMEKKGLPDDELV